MKTVQKYVLPAPMQSAVGFDLPLNSKVVYANVLGDTAYIYVWVGRTRNLTKRRFFAVIKDGVEVPENADYVTSFTDKHGAWHVIERKDTQH